MKLHVFNVQPKEITEQTISAGASSFDTVVNLQRKFHSPLCFALVILKVDHADTLKRIF